MIAFKAMTAKEWPWIQKRAHLTLMDDTQGIVAYETEGDQIKAIAVFDNFGNDNCHMHLAVDSPIVVRHGFGTEIARHIFITNGKKRVFGYTPGNNYKAIRLNRHIGCEEVGRVPNGHSEGVDYIIFSMDRKQAERWLPKEMKEEAA